MNRALIFAVALFASLNTSCVNGKFSPAVASGVIAAAEAPSCAMIGVIAGDQTVGSVCEDVADIVSAILSKLKFSTVPVDGSSLGYRDVTFDGRKVGLIRNDLADLVQAELNARAGQ